MAERFKTKPKILFGPGTFRSESGQMVTKTAADVAVMAEHFKLLAARGIYPGVSKGHPKGSDAPKHGELREVWIDPAGNRIVGPLVNLSAELAEAIAADEFEKVSIEFSDHWWDPEDELFRDNVITGVAVLGAKWPAFKDQPDRLTIARSQMSEAGGDDVNVYRLSMADIEEAPDEGGGENVEDKERKELLATIEELRTKIVELEAAAPDEEKESLKAELAEVKEKLELATKAGEKAAEKIADAEVKAKEDVVAGVLKEAVTADKDGNVRMKPDEAETLKPVLMAMDDSKTIKLSEGKDGGVAIMASPFEQMVATIKARPVVLKLAEQGVDDSDDLHKGKEPEKKSALSEMDIEVAKKCGLDPDEVERVNAEGYDPHADVAAAEAKRAEKK